MSTAPIRQHRYTFEEFCLLVPDSHKADLIDGVIYMASPASTDDNDLCGWLARILGDFLDERLLGGRLFIEMVAYRLDAFSSPEPDLGYVGPDKVKHILRGFVDCAPDVAIEIVSPDSRERDYVLKRSKYEQAGVREYWILDPHQRKVLFLRLGTEGKFKEVRPRAGKNTSKAIPGFWFRPDWLWQEPLPAKKTILKEILQG